ncbi:MAG TPA: hypothetical protein VH684_09875 [Xanthobacteraceae bacterium]|jgi:hypothetical protein
MSEMGTQRAHSSDNTDWNRGMAEIEQAAAALRREEPGLEPESPGYEPKAELHTARSVWILIAVIWVSVASAVSCAIGAALLVFG